MHQGWEKRFLLIDASERTASSPCKKPLFARIRRRVGRITAVGEIAAKHLPQRNHAQRGQHGTEEKGVPVVPRQLIEHPAEKRSDERRIQNADRRNQCYPTSGASPVLALQRRPVPHRRGDPGKGRPPGAGTRPATGRVSPYKFCRRIKLALHAGRSFLSVFYPLIIEKSG